MTTIGNGLQGRRDPLAVVALRPFAVVALGQKLIDIAARRKVGSVATHDDDAQCRIGRELVHHLLEPAPHGGIDGVELVGIEQRHRSQVAVAFEKNIGVHR